MHRLGFDGRRTLQFDRITQPWLRELAKRWVRLRLSSGLGLEAGGARAVVAITRFSRFLAAVGVEHIEPTRSSSCSNAIWQTWGTNAIHSAAAPTSAC